MAERTPQQPPINWERIATPDFLREAKVYESFPDRHLRCIVAREEGRWHLSMSHRSRYPSWDEMADARYRFVPNRAQMAMLAPPREEFVNAHDTALHLWEVPELTDRHTESGKSIAELRSALAEARAELNAMKHPETVTK